MFFTKILSGRVCPTGNSDSASSASGNDEEDDGICKMGYCKNCETAEQKCKCIAITYFQYPPMRHKSSGNGEYAVLPDTIADYENGYCNIKYIYVHGVKSIDSQTASQRYGNGSNHSTDSVEFKLKDTSTISISKCKASDKAGDNNRGYMDTLKIDDQELSFKHCSATKAPLTYSSGGTQPFRGKDACYWCQLDDIEGHGENKNYMKDTGSKNDWYKQATFRDDTVLTE